jgi:ABC-type branched-subunit amino acid transport system ATPase component
MRDYNDEQIALTIESSSPALLEWAATKGFSVRKLSSGKHSALLDTTRCAAEAFVQLSAILRSLWSIPEIVFHCRTNQMGSQRESRYSPTGYCTPCDTTVRKPSYETVLKILSQGLTDQVLDTDELTLEIFPNTTLAEILTSNIAALRVSTNANLLAAQEILSHCGLSHFPLGQSTTLMSAHDIARLTVAVSILGTTHNPGALLLDLPRSILADSAGSALETLLHDTARNRAVVVIGEPFAPQPKRNTSPRATELISTLTLNHDPHLAPQSFKLHRGATLSLNRTELNIPNLFQLCERDLLRPQALENATLVYLSNSPSCTLIPLLATTRHQHTRTLGDELGILERLAHMYAQSIDARMAGLSSKDLSISATRTNRNLCSACKGLGVTLQKHPQLSRPHATACSLCKGLRFKLSIAATLFKGVSYGEILNKPLSESASTLAALSKAKTTLELITTLNLDYLPLGMPTVLLSPSEQRRIELIKALCNSSPTKPGVIIIESPYAGFSPKEIEAIETLRRQHPLAQNCAWIEID